MRYRRYKSELEYSYALGMAPVMELIDRRPKSVLVVCVHPDYRADSGVNIFDICRTRGLRCETDVKPFNIAADKANIFVIAVFDKWNTPLSPLLPHAVFVNPADAGNLGSNLRTCLGFGFRDVAIIKPGADVYSPKAVRASMGAIFQINTVGFSSYDMYAASFPGHMKYCFMLDGKTSLNDVAPPGDGRFSLVFGNEAAGLPEEYHKYGQSVRIPHSGAIDSLNLSVAAGIAMYTFATSISCDNRS